MFWTTLTLYFRIVSNGLNKAYIWIDIKRDLSIVSVTNVLAPKNDEVMLTRCRNQYKRFTVSGERQMARGTL